MPYADHNGIRIHYRIEGDGPPLVLQHGSTARIERWYRDGYVDALKDRFRLVLVDARGHGASDKPHDRAAYALALRVGDVVAVLDAAGIARAHYLGYSMGGWIGFGLTRQAPERLQSLIIGGAHPYAESAAAFHGVDGTDPQAFAAALERFVGTRLSPAMKAYIAASDTRALAAAMHDRESLEDVLPGIAVPCLLFVGEDDPRFAGVRECARHIANATFVSLPGLDHVQALTRSDLVLPHVLRFLQTVAPVSHGNAG